MRERLSGLHDADDSGVHLVDTVLHDLLVGRVDLLARLLELDSVDLKSNELQESRRGGGLISKCKRPNVIEDSSPGP